MLVYYFIIPPNEEQSFSKELFVYNPEAIIGNLLYVLTKTSSNSLRTAIASQTTPPPSVALMCKVKVHWNVAHVLTMLCCFVHLVYLHVCAVSAPVTYLEYLVLPVIQGVLY